MSCTTVIFDATKGIAMANNCTLLAEFVII